MEQILEAIERQYTILEARVTQKFGAWLRKDMLELKRFTPESIREWPRWCKKDLEDLHCREQGGD